MARKKEESILLSTGHAAEFIGCSVQTLRNWHLYGRVPVPIVIANRLYWKRSELLQWIEAGCPCRDEWKQRLHTQKYCKDQKVLYYYNYNKEA